LPTNDYDVPIDINLEILIFRFNTLVEDYQQAISQLNEINKNINTGPMTQNLNLIKLIPDIKDESTTIIIKKNTTIDKVIFIKDKLNEYLSSAGSDCKVDNLYDLPPSQTKLKHTLVMMTSYYLTNGNINSVYNYGLSTKMFNKDYNITREWSWILENYTPKVLIDNPHGLFNLNYMDQVDYSGVHRSGWQYVYDHISFLHNSKSNLLLDLYIDRTFHWNNDINEILGIIPYSKPWCGFVHHTFNKEFSTYNCEQLLQNKNFIESLKVCRGLFVLSDTLCDLFKSALTKMNIDVPVFSLIHPTQTDVKLFTIDNFINNDNKKIINIGGWLRNIYHFYKLKVPDTITVTCKKTQSLFNLFNCQKKNCKIEKYILKGKNMSNYLPKDDLLPQLKDILSTSDNQQTDTVHGNISCNANVSCNNICENYYHDNVVITNNWYKHFYFDMNYIISTMNVINHIDNNSYDELLSCNVVFVNLVDASAVNTLIECIVRNTPIIINKIPAVVELLGNNYPLYYDDIIDVYKLINEKSITNAYKYLTHLNKQKFTIGYFINHFVTTLNTINAPAAVAV
jgi:hypothetical protein